MDGNYSCGAEPCVGRGGEGSRAAVLPLRAGTRLVLALSHLWRPSLGCWRCLPPSSAWQGYRDVQTAVGHIWLRMWRSGGRSTRWFVLPGALGLLLTSSTGVVTGRASTPVCSMILANSRHGSIPKCGCILPLGT